MRKYFYMLFLIIGCSNSSVVVETPEVEYLLETIQYKSISGIDIDLLSLDVHYPSNVESSKPVVIYVHGGGWSLGDKSQQLENKINLFEQLNYVFISINYRLSPFPLDTADKNRIMFPDHNNDVADAINWVVENIDKYGGDSSKIALLGHSAGAHLVALTGTNSSFLQNSGLSLSNIKGVAVIDTNGYDIPEQIANGSNPVIYINAFGTNAVQNLEASPIAHITNSIQYPKFFIAKRGSLDRLSYADEFISKLQLNGVAVSQINGSIYTHKEINEAIGLANETVITQPLILFFKECFK